MNILSFKIRQPVALVWKGLKVFFFEGALSVIQVVKAFTTQLRTKPLTAAPPANVQLSLNKTCNLHCTFCARQTKQVRDQLANEKTLIMSCDFLEKNRDLFKDADYVNLAADGEPLLHPEIKKILETIGAISNKPNIIFVTNGVLLTDELIELIVRMKIMEVHFSIDSLRKENLEFVRPGVDLNQLITSIERINLKKREDNSEFPVLVLRPTFISKTIEELPSMVEFCHRYGFRTILVQYMQIYKRELTQYSLFNCRDSVRKYIDIAHQKAYELGVGFTLDTAIKENENPNIEHLHGTLERMEKPKIVTRDLKVKDLLKKCTLPWDFMLIQTNGDVYPCCNSGYKLGNLNKESWENIWNGPRAMELRKKFRNNILPKECVDKPCGIGKSE